MTNVTTCPECGSTNVGPTLPGALPVCRDCDWTGWEPAPGADLHNDDLFGDDADEHGNVWMDEAVPSGTEIAHVFLEILADKGWATTFADYAGVRICPRVNVWLDGYMDRDYERVFLLRVWTDSLPEADGNRLTLTDHLAIYQRHAGTDHLSVEWRQEPRLFFDAGGEWLHDGLHWWVDWTAAINEADARTHHLTPEAEALIATHNAQVRQGHHDRAIAMGLGAALPYLTHPKESA